ncbi:MAG: pentapeptide repeat-containing protein [Candidatus Nanoarchaeia archaeon]
MGGYEFPLNPTKGDVYELLTGISKNKVLEGLSDEERVEIWNGWRKRGNVPPVLRGLEFVGWGSSKFDLSRVFFNGCSFSSATFLGIRMTASVFKKCKFKGVNFLGTSLQNVRMSACFFTDVTFKTGNLEGSDFEESFFVSVYFKEANLKKSKFFKAHFRFVNFLNCEMDKVNFREVTATKTDWEKCNLKGAHFEGSSVFGRFIESDLTGADFEKAQLEVSSFMGDTECMNVNFKGAELSRAGVWANCRGASFVGANLISTIFSGADLTGADFAGAVVEKEQLERGKNLRKAKNVKKIVPPGIKLSVVPLEEEAGMLDSPGVAASSLSRVEQRDMVKVELNWFDRLRDRIQFGWAKLKRRFKN